MGPLDKPNKTDQAVPSDRGVTSNRPGTSGRTDIAAFVAEAREIARPAATATSTRSRLIFALDATMSRQPTWDLACHYQARMFGAATDLGGLDVQLVYFRGQGECGASKWVGEAAALSGLMGRIRCRGGRTQIGKVLSHTLKAAKQSPVDALIYVGDAVEENPDTLCAYAGELALRGIPVFIFHEGTLFREGALFHEGAASAAAAMAPKGRSVWQPRGAPVDAFQPVAEPTTRQQAQGEATFREIARLTKGAYLPFDSGSAAALGDLLAAVASYASGGRSALKALEQSGNRKALLLLRQLA